MKEMTPRERVMTALRGGIPDRVPWGEAAVDWKLQVRLMEGRVDFKPAEFCRKMGMSCLPNLVSIEHKRDRNEAPDRQAVRVFDFTLRGLLKWLLMIILVEGSSEKDC